MELQEITPYIYMLLQKSDWWQQYKCLLSHEKAIQMPYYCMQVIILLTNFTCDMISNFWMNAFQSILVTEPVWKTICNIPTEVAKFVL